MASLQEVRDGIKTTLEGNVSGLRVYDVVPDYSINFPVAIVLPINIEFNISMQRGTDLYTFDILVAVERGNSRTAQDKLDAYITGQGSSSLRQAIFNNRTYIGNIKQRQKSTGKSVIFGDKIIRCHDFAGKP